MTVNSEGSKMTTDNCCYECSRKIRTCEESGHDWSDEAWDGSAVSCVNCGLSNDFGASEAITDGTISMEETR